MLSRRFGFGHRILSGAISRSFSTSAVFRSKKEYVLQYGAPLPAGLQAEVTAVCKPVPWSRFFPQQENMWTVDHSAIQTPGAQPTPLPASKWADIKPEEIRGMILFGHAKVTADTIKPFSNLKVVSNVGVGVDHIDLNALKARGIWAGHTPNVLNECVADHGFALMLASARNIVSGDKWMRTATADSFFKYPHYAPWLGREVSGSTLGIVGMGRIGAGLVRRARAFGMRVLYMNRTRKSAAEEQAMGVSYVALPELLASSDFVMLLVPYSAETRHIIGARELGAMKPGATLINIGRGGLVDTDALVQALNQNQSNGQPRLFASLDVTDPEPLPPNHPLRSIEGDRLVVVPHFGSATYQTRQKMVSLAVRNLLAGLSGQKPECNAYAL